MDLGPFNTLQTFKKVVENLDRNKDGGNVRKRKSTAKTKSTKEVDLF